MNGRQWIYACLAMVFSAIPSLVSAQDDPGRAVMGQVSVTVYYATNGEPAAAGKQAAVVPRETEKLLRQKKQLNFKSYRALGHDVQPLLRTYESWAQPLKPSDEVMVRFEANSLPTEQLMKLDLELWLGRKKILKTNARLGDKHPLFVLGPEWRGGRLIIAVALAPK